MYKNASMSISRPKSKGISLYLSLRNVLIPALVSGVGTIIALFPSNPNNMSLPSRDSGVFLYVGWRLLNGEMPYLDVWDHKPPLIYFVDAFGLLLSPQSLWGVWLLQVLFVFLTFFFLYRTLRETLGNLPASAGTVVMTSGLLTILDRGNVTEEYALVFQARCFWLFIGAQKKDYPLQNTFWLGLCAGLAFFFKQTTVGVWIAYAFILLMTRISQKKLPTRDFLTLLAGWATPLVFLVPYFASREALSGFWEQAFLYNFVYIGRHEGLGRLLPVFVKGFLYLSQGAVLYLGILGWLAGLGHIWINRKPSFQNTHPLILLAVINFPIEIALITVSGRSILHYYLTPLPVIAILAGVLVYAIPLFLRKMPYMAASKMQTAISAILLSAILLLQAPQVRTYSGRVEELAQYSIAPLIEYVITHTDQDDYLLVIGAESVVNFLARRAAPTRYVYQYPLQLLGRRTMFEEHFRQILENKPALIIDTRGRSRLDENLYTAMQRRSLLVRDGVKYLAKNYQPVAKFDEWVVYRLTESP